MKYIKVVIGSNFGDEGKGLMTDYLSSISDKPIVIRFNSSAQAGHTVVNTIGYRHVFGHFGSGSLLGVKTYLSRYFSVNPLLFLKEYEDLKKIIEIPTTLIDINCPIVIPQDMILNQLIERQRGNNRHGSCGLGYNESVIRNKIEKYRITCKDIIDKTYKNKLYYIQEKYLEKRLEELNLTSSRDELMNILKDENIISHFISDVENEFINKVDFTDINKITDDCNTIVFEGAQGLMLSENYKYFPYVTHSKTGIRNVINLLKETDEEELDIEVIYVTRSYFTRHGAGPLPNEIKKKPYEKIEDKTNIPNEFQGALRFAPLDIDILAANIEDDFIKLLSEKYFKNCNINKSIAITCLNQIDDDKAIYYKDNNLVTNSTNELIRDIYCSLNPYKCYLSYGPTRKDTIIYNTLL